MRAIDADELREYWLYNGLNERVYDTNDVLYSIDEQPTVDPETLRPTAHIMRGTVQCTRNAGFCSNCKLCIDEDYGTALAKSYNYCPYCSARIESAE
jgi:hypothetical protein